MENLFSEDAKAMKPSAIRSLEKITPDASVISLAGGHPSPEAFPIEDLKAVLRSLAADLPAEVLQYGPTAGNQPLRREVVKILEKRGIKAGEGQVLLCSGSQRGLDLLGRVLLDPRDTILIEVPSYPGAIACFRNLRARMIGVAQDEMGVRMDLLESTLERLRTEHRRPKLLYTVPNFQNPSGATLLIERRAELIEIATREDFLILEDDPYGELYFNENASLNTKPLAALNAEQVIYMSSFSKILAPGLRTAFIYGPPALIEKVELAAQAADLCSSMLDQRIILELIKSGVLSRSIERGRSLYREHGETILGALEEFMPEGVEWNRPQGGFFLWVRLPEEIDAEAMLPEALERKVAYVAGKHFCVDGSGGSALRLSYSKETPERLRAGVIALAETIKNYSKNDSRL